MAAVPVNWHVVPNERDAIMGQAFDPAKTTFETVVYRQYTKDWARQIPNAPGDEGIQGPVLHANVGDKILVHFENLDTVFNRPHSMHFHGVHYRPGSDGSYVPGFSGPGANVAPGKTFTYRLTAGPDSAGVWPYHDHSPSMDESIAGGLYGVLSILGPGQQPPDHEFVVFFQSTLDFKTVDGHAFVGNTPVFHAKVGDVVQWDVLALGEDFHTFHVHGHRWQLPDGTSIDTPNGRPGGELRRALEGGRPWHLALPLPRRGPHGGRDDRHLPGLAMSRARAAAGLAAVLACAAAVAPALGAEGRVREVSIPGQTYAPSQLQVLVGDTVLWRNGDVMNHTVTSDGVGFDSGYLAPGSTFSFVFSKAGRYAYHCTIHKFMKGVVVVVPIALQGPPGPVVAGGRAVLQGLAPAGAKRVLVEQLGGGRTAVHRATPAGDGSFTVRVRIARPTVFRAAVKRLQSSQILVRVAPRVDARLRGRSPERAGGAVAGGCAGGAAAVRAGEVRLADGLTRPPRRLLTRVARAAVRPDRAVPDRRARRPRLGRRGIRRSRPLTAHPDPSGDAARTGIEFGRSGRNRVPGVPRIPHPGGRARAQTPSGARRTGSRIDSHGRPGGAWPTTTLHVTSYSVLYGHTVTIGGRISNHRAGVHVVLLAQRYGHTRATRAATLTTRVGGYWRFRARPPIQTDYRARVGANLGQPVRVGVAPVVSVRELRNGRLAVRVTAARSFNGRAVKLQRRTGGAWRTVSQHELGLHSAAVIRPNLPASFVRIAMSVNQAGAGYLGSASHVLHYRPLRVTLLTSSYKTRFGNTITLHGRVTTTAA